MKSWIKKIIGKNTIKKIFSVIFTIKTIYTRFINLVRSKDKYCPCCKNRFNKFVMFKDNRKILKSMVGGGSIVRRCPYCFSHDRERLLMAYLSDVTDLHHKKILHVAPEKNIMEYLKESSDEYLSVDIESPLAMQKMDITNIQLEDNSYDLILCNHVLEHIEDDNKAMSEIYRVLKKNGQAILQVPLDYNLKKSVENKLIENDEARKKHFGHAHHVRINGVDYFEKLKCIGFKVDLRSYDNKIIPYGLIEEEKLIICEK